MRRAVYALGALCALSACASRQRTIGPDQWEVLLRLPQAGIFQLTSSPEGALFAAGADGIYRALPGHDESWAKLVADPGVVTKLYAPSTGLLYALTNGCGHQVFRWDSTGDWRRLETPVSNAARVSAHGGVECPVLYDVWGTGGSDVYIVGDRGVLLHFDGQRWALERHPLLAFADSAAPAVYRSQLWSIGGDSAQVYAGGIQILRLTAGAWDTVPRPPGMSGNVRAIAVRGDAALFGATEFGRRGGDAPGLFQLRGGRWEALGPRLRGFRRGIYEGRTQADGSALFYTYSGEVAEVGDGGVRVYVFPVFRQFAGAVAIGPALYIGGAFDEDGVVARVKRLPPRN